MADCTLPHAQVPGGRDWGHAGPPGEARLPCEASCLPPASRMKFSGYSTSRPSRFLWGIWESIMENWRLLLGGIEYLSSPSFYLRLVNMDKLCFLESVAFFVPDSNLTFKWLKEGNNSWKGISLPSKRLESHSPQGWPGPACRPTAHEPVTLRGLIVTDA